MKFFFFTLIMLNIFSSAEAKYDKLAYEFMFKGINEETINLKEYKDSVILIVNVASRCGFTGQYEGLQKLWSTYKEKNITIIGVPTNNFNQEPGSNSEIKTFCETNFGVEFPMTEKINVLGEKAHPFYKWAKENHGIGAIPKWNFHKIVINKYGKVDKTFSSITSPSSKKFIRYIEEQIKN